METALTVQISSPATGLALRGPAGREFALLVPKATASTQQAKLIRALQPAEKNLAIWELTHDDLDLLLKLNITSIRVLMGYTNLLADKEGKDLKVMVTAVGNHLLRKHRYLRQQEIPLILKMGAEGEFDNEKDRFLPLSLPMFTAWFSRYLYQTRAEAIKNAQELGAETPPSTLLPDAHPLVLRYNARQIIAKVQEIATTGKYQDFDDGHTLYATLKCLGLFEVFYTLAYKQQMWQEELEEVQKSLTGVGRKKRIESYQEALAELGRPPEHDPITWAAIRACKKRTMKEWVMECVLNKTDVGNLLMHLVETQPWTPPTLSEQELARVVEWQDKWSGEP